LEKVKIATIERKRWAFGTVGAGGELVGCKCGIDVSHIGILLSVEL
jgi:hypothetical protein